MLTMTKRLEFDAGHRLVNHESKCSNLHGHRYAVEVEITLVGGLDHAGRIVDFGDVKALLGTWIDEHLDHTFIANEADPMLDAIRAGQRKAVFVMECEPSAENLAAMLLGVARDMLDVEGARRVTRVTIWETPTSRAEAT